LGRRSGSGTQPLRPWIKVQDERGLQTAFEEEETLELRFEQVFAAAEARIGWKWRPWWDSNPRSPP